MTDKTITANGTVYTRKDAVEVLRILSDFLDSKQDAGTETKQKLWRTVGENYRMLLLDGERET